MRLARHWREISFFVRRVYIARLGEAKLERKNLNHEIKTKKLLTNSQYSKYYTTKNIKYKMETMP